MFLQDVFLNDGVFFHADSIRSRAALKFSRVRGVDERRRLLNAEAELFRRRLAETEDEAARSAVEAEMNRRLSELVQDYRGFQEKGLEDARAAVAKIEAFRDELAGPAGNPLRPSR